MASLGRPKQNNAISVWRYVRKTAHCWYWIGPKDPGNYGRFTVDGKTWRAHRYIYTLVFGDISEGMLVMHSCDRPNCVNPKHLSLGTPDDNMQDALKKGRLSSGRTHYRTNLTEAKVRAIRNSELSNSELAEKYQTTHITISHIRRGISWRQVSGPIKTGRNVPGAKLKESDVHIIRQRIASGDQLKKIAFDYNVTPDCISLLHRKLTWQYV